jgi:uncharacterized protein YqjF (DUF2071 family)
MHRDLLRVQEHRPWPIRRFPWAMTQTWSKLLFAHWPVPLEMLRPLIPAHLTLDTFEGQAWVGVVPFVMSDVRFRMLLPIPGTTTFLELNVRTYVTCEGKPGVWFFSLDASNPLAVEAARLGFHLPYFHASMSIDTTANRVLYRSQRKDKRTNAGVLKAEYQPVGDIYSSQPGSLDHFLTERYCLYSVSKRGVIYRADIHHLPWPLQRAEATLEVNTVTNAFGITLPDVPPLLHYAERLPMLAWTPERLPNA